MAFLGGSTAIALAGMQQTVAMSQARHRSPALAACHPSSLLRRSTSQPQLGRGEEESHHRTPTRHPLRLPTHHPPQIYHFGFDSSSGKSPAPSQLAQYGIALAVVLACNCAAALPMKFIDRIAIASFGWLLFAALLIIVVIPVMARGHPGAGYAPACNPALGPAGCFNPNPTDQNSKCVSFPARLSPCVL